MNLNKTSLSWVRLLVLFALSLSSLVASSSAHGQECPGGCDDGNPCTIDSCVDGVCMNMIVAGSSCTDDGNPCTLDVCDNTGACAHMPLNDTSCGDDFNECTLDICVNGECQHQPQIKACDDYNKCTELDMCTNGLCVGVPKDCSFLDQEPCIAGACNPSTGECEEKDICLDECTWDIEMDLDVDGTDLSIFIRGGSLVDLPIFAPNFGRTNCPSPMMK